MNVHTCSGQLEACDERDVISERKIWSVSFKIFYYRIVPAERVCLFSGTCLNLFTYDIRRNYSCRQYKFMLGVLILKREK